MGYYKDLAIGVMEQAIDDYLAILASKRVETKYCNRAELEDFFIKDAETYIGIEGQRIIERCHEAVATGKDINLIIYK